MAKKRILIICDSPTLNTGYSRVGRFVADTLVGEEYDVRYLPCNAENMHGNPAFKYYVYPFSQDDRYNVNRIVPILTEYMPSLVMVFGEFAYVAYIGSICRDMNIRAMYYFPIEGKNYPPEMVYIPGGTVDYKLALSKFHYLIAYSNFGMAQIHKILPGIVTEVISHQVNTDIFRPLDRKKCLQIFLPNLLNDPNLGLDKIFIVGAVYRNMRRKGTDLLLRGFARFLAKYEDKKYRQAFLTMVMDPKDPYGFNIKSMIDMYDLRGRVVMIPVIGGKAGPDDHGLCEVYNTFDVHCCPFRGEGFGIPIIESLACGIRTVCTNFATPAIFGKDVCEFIEPIDFEPIPGTNCEWAVLHPEDVADAINVVYQDKGTKEPYQKGVDLAKTFSEPAVAKQWVGLLKDIDLPERVHVSEPTAPDQQDTSLQNYYKVLEEG